MAENMKGLRDAAEADENLKEELRKAVEGKEGEELIEAVRAFADEHGVDLDEEPTDISAPTELSDAELEEVTGGTWIWDIDIERGYEFLIEKKFGKYYADAIGVGAFLVMMDVDPVLRDLRQRWVADGCPTDKTYHYNNRKQLVITDRGGRI